jgi:Tfp pilus assembly protein PilO
MVKIFVLIVLIAVIFLIGYALIILSEEKEEKFDEDLTPQQSKDYQFYKNWILEHTDKIVTKEEFLEGKYTDNINLLRNIQKTEKDIKSVQDFRNIMRGGIPSSKVIKGKEDSSDGMPIFNN